MGLLAGRIKQITTGSLLAASLLIAPFIGPLASNFEAKALVSSSRSHKSHKKSSKRSTRKKSKYRSISRSNRRYKYSSRSRKSRKRRKSVRKAAPKPVRPQDFISNLNVLTLKPGLVFRYFRGPLCINVAEVDIRRNNLAVRPYLAGYNFDRLKTVQDHASEGRALVAVNANYFKKDGTPLGAIKMDGEWISGSLFNRVAMGITRDKEVKFAPVNLHGILKTSNPHARSLWVNNMNQPRIHGARMVLYTRRWGDSVKLAYDGTLVGVNSKGEVVDRHSRAMRIPFGGYVLTDKKESKLAYLKKGDQVHLSWHTSPKDWNDVEHAISGGPTLVKNGRLYVGLKAEKFKMSWTSSKITHRTACGFTKDKKLLLVTVEGPHNMWDLAKFMHGLGCVDAMNLDGGGSTSMVVCGKDVTRNAHRTQRKVAATLMVLEPATARQLARTPDRRYHPTIDLTSFTLGHELFKRLPTIDGASAAKAQQNELHLLTGQKVSSLEALLQSDAHKSDADASQTEEKSTMVFKYPKNEQVIDIDDDLLEVSDREENLRLKTEKKKQKRENREAQSKSKKSSGWSKRLLKPFSFSKKEG